MDAKGIARLLEYVEARAGRRGLHDDIIHSLGTGGDSIDLTLTDLRALLTLAEAVQDREAARVIAEQLWDTVNAEMWPGGVDELEASIHWTLKAWLHTRQTVALVPVPAKEG